MSLLNCFLLDCCPLATSLTDIPATVCPENIGQIQRYWFVRKGIVKLDTVSPFTNSTPAAVQSDPTALATWNVLFTAADDSHVVLTPLIGGDPSITASAPTTFGGGDNSTLSGEQFVTAIPPSDASVRFDSLTAAQIAALRKLTCEGNGLEVYLISQEGKIWGKKVGNIFSGIDCTNVVLGSLTNSGFGTRDSNTMTFQLPFDWDETKAFLTPSDFNALTV